jgi:hypothetical protein
MTDYWFRPHTYGYGATPANWKGWVATLGCAAAVIGLSLLVFSWQVEPATSPEPWRIAVWGLLELALIAAFIRLARAKTDGQWAWRWGK